MSNQNEEVGNINSLINYTYHKAAIKMGINDSEMSIFYVLKTRGNGCNQSEIYKSTGMRKSTVNSAIQKMKRENLLYLSPGEGRNMRVFLTEKGIEKCKKTVEYLLKVENTILQSWNKEERESFVELNHKFFHQLRDEIETL